MAATHKSTSHTGARRTRRTGRRDPLAITLLKKDHREVAAMFEEYEQMEAEGRVDQSKGNLKQAGEKVKDAFKK